MIEIRMELVILIGKSFFHFLASMYLQIDAQLRLYFSVQVCHNSSAVQVLSGQGVGRPRGRSSKSPNTRSRRHAAAARRPAPPQSMQIAGSNLLLSPRLLSKCILNSSTTTPAFVPSFSLNLCLVDFNGNILFVIQSASTYVIIRGSVSLFITSKFQFNLANDLIFQHVVS